VDVSNQRSCFLAPTVVDGTVFVGSDDSNLYAVDAATGEQEWVFETEAAIESSPIVADGTAYVRSNDGNLYALDTGVKGSIEESGTLGNRGEADGDETEETADGAPGFGVPAAITSLGGAGYLLQQRLSGGGSDNK
jgi:PGF-CTERM protein